MNAASFPDAACRTDGTPEAIAEMHVIFYGTFGENGSHSQARHQKAVALCETCPALEECRRWALDNWWLVGDQDFKPHQGKGKIGIIIGGLTSWERWEIRQKEKTPRPGKRIDHGTGAGYRLHLFRGEPACEECKKAERERERVRRWRKRMDKQKQDA